MEKKNERRNYEKLPTSFGTPENSRKNGKNIFSKILVFIATIFTVVLLIFILKPNIKELEEKRYIEFIKKCETTLNNFTDICFKGINLNREKFPKNNNPKISVIIPVYNAYKFLRYSLRSVQNQKMKEIEIILIDDASNDNITVNVIKDFQKEDNRIILIQHEKNKGILYSVSEGILTAKGKYIMQLDQDDLFASDDLFDILYKFAEENSYDIIQFDYRGFDNLIEKRKLTPLFSNMTVTQPHLTEIGFLNTGDSKVLWDKIINTAIFKDAINKLGKNIYSEYIMNYNDHILLFMIYKISKSYFRISKLGQLKFVSDESASGSRFREDKIKQTCFDYLFFSNTIFDLSLETKFEKMMAVKRGCELINMFKNEMILYQKEYTLSTLEKYLNCSFIDNKTIIIETYNFIKNGGNKENITSSITPI